MAPLSILRKVYLDTVRLIRITGEFIHGFHFFGYLPSVISVFGSARIGPPHPGLAIAREFGERAGNAGFTVLTGGGASFMQAANEGAKKTKARRKRRRCR